MAEPPNPTEEQTSQSLDEAMQRDYRGAFDELAKAEAQIDRYRAALERIADLDYRGNEPEERRIAREALDG